MSLNLRRRPTAYDRGQHELIGQALGIPTDPNAPGSTAYEGVCILLLKLHEAVRVLKIVKTDEAKAALKFIRAKNDSPTFCCLPMFSEPPKF